MLIPLVTLAILSIVGGFIGWPKSLLGGEWFGKFLEPVFEGNPSAPMHDYSQGIEYFLMGLSVVTAIAGIGIAYRMYVRQPALSDRVADALAGPHRLLLHKYYVDEIYDALFVHRVKDLGSLLAAFDMGVVDGGVNGVGWLTRMSSELSRLVGYLDYRRAGERHGLHREDPELARAHRTDGFGTELCLVYHRRRDGVHDLLHASLRSWSVDQLRPVGWS